MCRKFIHVKKIESLINFSLFYFIKTWIRTHAPLKIAIKQNKWVVLGATHFSLHQFQETFHHEKVSLCEKFDSQVIKFRFLKIPKICNFWSKMRFSPKKLKNIFFFAQNVLLRAL